MRWSRLPSGLVANMLGGHLTLGLAASVLLYILCVSGTALVFHEEFERWEQPAVPEMDTVTPAAAGRAARSVLAQLDQSPHHFYVGFPTPTMPRLWLADDESTWFANRSGEIVARGDHEWSHFLEKLHYYLTLPLMPGLTLVGILGVLMAGLCLSGLFAHPRLFRDAFRLRLKSGPRLARADLHNRLSVWAFPFHLVIAVTGAALGLSLLVAAVFAPAVNDGDTASFFDPIFGAEVEGSEQPAPLADFESAVVRFTAENPDTPVWLISFHDPATAGQSGEILARYPRRLIYGDYIGFDAAGELTARTGLADGAVGQQVTASLYPLHFGSFGGLPVKLAYGLLGIALCVVVASGINIWLTKRRQAGRGTPVMERAWIATVWGCPAALAGVLAVDLAVSQSMSVLVTAYWVFQLGLIVAAMARPGLIGRRALQMTTALLLVAAVAWHVIEHAGAGQNSAAHGVNLVLLAIAGTFGWLGMRSRRSAGQEALAQS